MAQWPRLKMMDSICMVRFTHILQYSRKMAKLATSSSFPLLVIALELHPVEDRLTYALPRREPVVVIEREVDAPVEPGDSRFGRRLLEGVEHARLLGRHQTVVGVRRVREALDPEHVGEDVRRRP